MRDIADLAQRLIAESGEDKKPEPEVPDGVKRG